MFVLYKLCLFFDGQRFLVVVLDRFFSFGGQKKWCLVELDRWSSYAVTIVWESAWSDSTLVVQDEWSSDTGGRLSRSDCTNFLALAACVRTMLKDCVTIRDLAWRILKSINNQFETIYVVCGTSTEKTIKNAESCPVLACIMC